MNVNFQRQYSFEDCKNKATLFFDFGILDDDNNLKCLIEYQGEQHYKISNYFGGQKNFEKQQENDSIKRQYCINKNIKLIEIPYWEFKNLSTLLYQHIFDIFGNIANNTKMKGC
jgi:hypothetical protein